MLYTSPAGSKFFFVLRRDDRTVTAIDNAGETISCLAADFDDRARDLAIIEPGQTWMRNGENRTVFAVGLDSTCGAWVEYRQFENSAADVELCVFAKWMARAELAG